MTEDVAEPATESGVKLHAPATSRNREAIASILKDLLPETGTVLEIASGSGQHTAYFAPLFPCITWQPSDISQANLQSIREWTRDSEGSVEPPVRLDATDPVWPVSGVQGIFCANMIHISPWQSTPGLMNGAGNVLAHNGFLYLYGPFVRDGTETAPSNMAFHEHLQQQNPAWGIRNLTEVADHANMNGLSLDRVVEMPANNLSIIFRKI